MAEREAVSAHHRADLGPQFLARVLLRVGPLDDALLQRGAVQPARMPRRVPQLVKRPRRQPVALLGVDHRVAAHERRFPRPRLVHRLAVPVADDLAVLPVPVQDLVTLLAAPHLPAQVLDRNIATAVQRQQVHGGVPLLPAIRHLRRSAEITS